MILIKVKRDRDILERAISLSMSVIATYAFATSSTVFLVPCVYPRETFSHQEDCELN